MIYCCISIPQTALQISSFLGKITLSQGCYFPLSQVLKTLSRQLCSPRWINDELEGPDLMPDDKDLRNSVEAIFKKAEGVINLLLFLCMGRQFLLFC